jgi:hypothetical protein
MCRPPRFTGFGTADIDRQLEVPHYQLLAAFDNRRKLGESVRPDRGQSTHMPEDSGTRDR